MTREMSDPDVRELNIENYSAKAIDVMLAPEKGKPQLYKTASDYINARSKQFSQNSYTGELIQTRHEELALSLKTVRGTHTRVGTFTELPKLNINETWQQPAQVQIALMLEAAARYKAQGDIKKSDITTREAEKLVRNYSSLKTNAKIRSGIAAVSLALAACSQPLLNTQSPEALATATSPVVSELVPTQEQEQQMLDSFDYNGYDLSVKVNSPATGIENLPVDGIDRVVSISGFEDPEYSNVTMAQMQIQGQEGAPIEFWSFGKKDGSAPESYFVVWTPAGADANSVKLNALKMVVDVNNVAGVPHNPEVVGSAIIPQDANSPISISIDRPGNGSSDFKFDLKQPFFNGIQAILDWDAHVAEAGEENPVATQSSTAVNTQAVTEAPTEILATEEPTTEATVGVESTSQPESLKINAESVTTMSDEWLLNGLVEVNNTDAGLFYRDTLASFLEVEANKEFFEINFGVKDFSSPTLVDDILSVLRQQNYVFPEGLKLPIDKLDSTGTLVVEMPEFRFDTIIVEAVLPATFLEKRASGEIKNADFYNLDDEGVVLLGNNLKQLDGDSLPRLRFLVASSVENRIGLSEVNPSDPESINIPNNWLMFFPHLFRNIDNARDFRGKKLLDMFNYFYGHSSIVEIDGNYVWNGTPDLNILQFKQ